MRVFFGPGSSFSHARPKLDTMSQFRGLLGQVVTVEWKLGPGPSRFDRDLRLMFHEVLIGVKIEVMGRLRKYILILMGLCLLAGPVLALYGQHACDLHTHAEDSLEDANIAHAHVHHDHAEPTSASSQADQPCHCHVPCSHITQSAVTYTSETIWTQTYAVAAQWHRLTDSIYKSSPDLDGPFQPPRA